MKNKILIKIRLKNIVILYAVMFVVGNAYGIYLIRN